MGALDQLADWDVPTVAAAVFDTDDIRDQHGDTERTSALASVSKVLAAVTTHVAVEEGSVGLDDAAGPEGSTVRHLLAHASGLAPDGEYQVLGPPERKRIYSNLGFEVLAGHLEERTGMTYEEYARLALVDTLGLAQTDVSGSPAHAHRSSVDDLCTLLRSVVGGNLLAPSTVAAMTTPAFPELAGVLPGYGGQDPNPWGLGVEVRGDKDPHWTSADNSPRTWGHFGRAGTFVWFDPDVDLGLVVLTDRDFGPWAIEAWPTLSSDVLSEHR
ncbi:serine hydrolase domain-containing protein [Actinospongicola halichondriae]|uniref:serine hydrolase domain-containing protein n=1 Tax=Actinospongicola halichondriae TaxID=3236844 RepID=UPI003D37E92C